MEELERENIERYPNPEDSIYYHPTLNPYGVPPPGAQPMFRNGSFRPTGQLTIQGHGVLPALMGSASTPEDLETPPPPPPSEPAKEVESSDKTEEDELKLDEIPLPKEAPPPFIQAMFPHPPLPSGPSPSKIFAPPTSVPPSYIPPMFPPPPAMMRRAFPSFQPMNLPPHMPMMGLPPHMSMPPPGYSHPPPAPMMFMGSHHQPVRPPQRNIPPPQQPVQSNQSEPTETEEQESDMQEEDDASYLVPTAVRVKRELQKPIRPKRVVKQNTKPKEEDAYDLFMKDMKELGAV